jgi:hypothetical protein
VSGMWKDGGRYVWYGRLISMIKVEEGGVMC